MPNTKFQNLILDNMKSQGILSQNDSVNDITQDNMAKLKWVSNCYDNKTHHFELLSDHPGIDSYSIEGLQYATNIKALQLSELPDNTPNVNNPIIIGDITNISPIINLKNLNYIWLDGNRISDISPIVNLQNSGNVKYVNLNGNSIYDSSKIDVNKYSQEGISEAKQLDWPGNPNIMNNNNPDISNQHAETPPVNIDPNNNSYTLDINNIIKLPNNEHVTNISPITGGLYSGYFEDKNNQRLFAYLLLSNYGTTINQINDTTIQYNNLPDNYAISSRKFTRLPKQIADSTINAIYNTIPTRYEYYMFVQNNDDSSVYCIPYKFSNQSYVHVRYIDENNKELLDSTVLDGNIGNKYSTQPKKIDGYILKQIPVNKEGMYSDSPITVNYVYDKDQPAVQNGSVTVNYIDKDGHKLSDPAVLNGDVGANYSTHPKNIDGYSLTNQPNNADGKFTKDSITVNYVYNKNQPAVQNGSVTVNYIDKDGHKLSDPAVLNGDVGANYSTHPKNIDGYSLTNQPNNADGKFTKDGITVNYVYSNNSNHTNNSNSISNNNDSSNKSCNCKCPTKIVYIHVDKNESNKLSKKYKGLAVYALRHINMYKNLYEKNHKLNSKNNILYSYIKKPRIKAPMFVVNRVIKLSNGKIYYRVKDVNNKSKTKHLKGYITANNRYITRAYYSHKPDMFTVINPQGVVGSRHSDLKDVVKIFPQGTVLKFKKIVKHNLTTRYLLPNGNYVTGNRKLIKLGKHYQVKKVKAKKNIYLYKNIDLTQRRRVIKKNTIIKIRYYDYSYRYNFDKTGFKVYLVNGGYINSNHNNLKIIQ
ncbi:hypothetical protein DY123_07460 [Apilactobacillus micheneri]|uniref:MucBP domain-containing protein n=1 Tax=Apilactobacillus micheneri TaxID=1899430 RepID=UPI00112DB8C3|nr:MucBP domain-containing protein [Apilactobacillus micheneri]TPR41217.1 hypothetical protein DY123_07460 [Apilactobacillus micheneri]